MENHGTRMAFLFDRLLWECMFHENFRVFREAYFFLTSLTNVPLYLWTTSGYNIILNLRPFCWSISCVIFAILMTSFTVTHLVSFCANKWDSLPSWKFIIDNTNTRQEFSWVICLAQYSLLRRSAGGLWLACVSGCSMPLLEWPFRRRLHTSWLRIGW